MTLDCMKEQIVRLLHDSIKAYELPKVCCSLGLANGDEEEAYRSKNVYVRTRLKGKSKNEIIAILPKIKELTGCDLLPEERYKYEISNVTKRDIARILIDGEIDQEDVFFETKTFIRWNGEISELEFIKRVCDTSIIPVRDSRCKSFDEEYYRHRVQNDDWDDSFFFTDDRLPYKNASTQEVIRILCEIFHPEVRNENGNWRKIKELIGSLLEKDGFEFYECGSISGRSVYGIRKIVFIDSSLPLNTGLKKIEEAIGSEHIRKEVKKALESSSSDSMLAIGQAKELVETACKYILRELNVDYSNKDFPALSKLAREQLGLERNEKKEHIPGVAKIMSGLSNLVDGMAELRNRYGTGHGKDPSFRKLPIRYGLLAVSAASSYVEFLLESFEDLKKRNNA